MAVTINNPELEAHVTEKARLEGISADLYLDQLVREDKQRDEEIRREVRAGFASIERGDYTEYTENNIEELFDEIEIFSYIAEDSAAAARRMNARFRKVFAALASMPGMGRAREEVEPGIRSFSVGNYVVFYREKYGSIEVSRVLHGKRDERGIGTESSSRQ